MKMVAFWVLATHPHHFQLTLDTTSLPKAFTGNYLSAPCR